MEVGYRLDSPPGRPGRLGSVAPPEPATGQGGGGADARAQEGGGQAPPRCRVGVGEVAAKRASDPDRQVTDVAPGELQQTPERIRRYPELEPSVRDARSDRQLAVDRRDTL